MFHSFPGNEKVIKRLCHNAAAGKVSHAYLFEGDKSMDKMQFALDFVRAFMCPDEPGTGCERCATCNKINHSNYEDLFIIQKDGKSVKNDSILRLQEKLLKKPIGGDKNVAIINDADTMTISAQNKLLKTLEEPPGDAVIILVCSNIDKMLPTIISRCLTVRLNNFTAPEGESMNRAESFAQVMMGDFTFAEKVSEIKSISKNREEIEVFLDALEVHYRNLLVVGGEKSRKYTRNELYNAIQSIEEARYQLIDRNVKPEHVLKRLILKIGG